MYDNETCGSLFKREGKNLPRVNNRGVKRTQEHRFPRRDVVFGVQGQHVQPFLL